MKSLFAIIFIFSIGDGTPYQVITVEQLKPLVRHGFQCENVKKKMIEQYELDGYKVKSATCYTIKRGIPT